ncbi:hypothetical protein C9374_009467 [Naegleria lovaniensis]|uniref:Uncharacterized protein n=1 Tax=Naegleria lovaniensis TaxID=51637 RepID=A0AA88KWX1_NAELO|nr:uncharacterized protein C9374_009467 [Naegleria lovaniensis]KAG2392890.1 hypothetical protein C9374_009467 [Naegleria lovaniensis]
MVGMNFPLPPLPPPPPSGFENESCLSHFQMIEQQLEYMTQLKQHNLQLLAQTTNIQILPQIMIPLLQEVQTEAQFDPNDLVFNDEADDDHAIYIRMLQKYSDVTEKMIYLQRHLKHYLEYGQPLIKTLIVQENNLNTNSLQRRKRIVVESFQQLVNEARSTFRINENTALTFTDGDNCEIHEGNFASLAFEEKIFVTVNHGSQLCN